MKRIVVHDSGRFEGELPSVVETIGSNGPATALTGAGVSVESGIPDFRSEGGLWSRFDPMEYATLSCFLGNPAKAWELYRELGRSIANRRPNSAHQALADLEREGRLAGIVTQNVDGLHQAAGSRTVVELHGEHTRQQCLRCGTLEPLLEHHLAPGPVPECANCGFPLKPNVVLFEEPVRDLDAAHRLIDGSRLLLVVGTSAEVAPASQLPRSVLARGGSLIEFNLEPTQLTRSGLGPRGAFIQGPVGATLPLVSRQLLS